jgi:ubiquinone/menaquinone biosynthesis C-methylase UbiE
MSLVAGVREAYDASAQAWLRGPEVVYEALAEALIGSSEVTWAEARVLDLGAGTGTASRAARRAGARYVVAVDVSRSMLEAGHGWDLAIACDASQLPFVGRPFDVAVAAFSVGHLPDPVGGMAEARRVAGSLVASAFRARWTHPAKAIVDETAAGIGFVAPAWYQEIKAGPEAEVDDPKLLAKAASDAGFAHVSIDVLDVDVGLRTAEDIAAWRLGMAHLAPFVASLPDDRRHDLLRHCVEALAGTPAVVVPMVALTATS